jgi:hypothetical protein
MSLQLWQPPDKAEVSKADAYKQHLDKSNDLAVTELVAEQRDAVMRKQLTTAGKFMDKIEEHLKDVTDEKLNRAEQRKTLRSLAETMKIVADVQAKAAGFDLVNKPKPPEDTGGRVNLFVQCSPISVSGHRPMINVTPGN